MWQTRRHDVLRLLHRNLKREARTQYGRDLRKSREGRLLGFRGMPVNGHMTCAELLAPGYFLSCGGVKEPQEIVEGRGGFTRAARKIPILDSQYVYPEIPRFEGVIYGAFTFGKACQRF